MLQEHYFDHRFKSIEAKITFSEVEEVESRDIVGVQVVSSLA